MTVSKISFTLQLPKSLLPRIQAVPGVADVTYANWFGGIYQDPKNFFPNQAVARELTSTCIPEWQLMPAEQRQAFQQHAHRRGRRARRWRKKFHWKVGDKIPLQATIFPQKNGSNTWTSTWSASITSRIRSRRRAGECAVVQLGLLRRGARSSATATSAGT